MRADGLSRVTKKSHIKVRDPIRESRSKKRGLKTPYHEHYHALSTPSPTPCTLFLVGGGVISSREKIPFDTKIGLCQWTRMIRISSFLEILHVY